MKLRKKKKNLQQRVSLVGTIFRQGLFYFFRNNIESFLRSFWLTNSHNVIKLIVDVHLISLVVLIIVLIP